MSEGVLDPCPFPTNFPSISFPPPSAYPSEAQLLRHWFFDFFFLFKFSSQIPAFFDFFSISGRPGVDFSAFFSQNGYPEATFSVFFRKR